MLRSVLNPLLGGLMMVAFIVMVIEVIKFFESFNDRKTGWFLLLDKHDEGALFLGFYNGSLWEVYDQGAKTLKIICIVKEDSFNKRFINICKY